ncbi:hypothetical protein CORC01_04934 [Colletotrichum orchidophilum]|uniref:Uncharacterized protein n=1 Tax=Colletotrichum orchidophilum TaxID=1209926 RepID=A0A1G4BEJ2_9PEZI|nr:uncharacterized protein CORC01_04934 [Colletotrichum orchidophilum]OHE99798.1 hypothetical protein CORC01_04934 [Colletotrichum orchidophilum]
MCLAIHSTRCLDIQLQAARSSWSLRCYDPDRAALAGLGVNADAGLVAAANVDGAKEQVGDLPVPVVGLNGPVANLKASLDGVLVGAGDGADDEGAVVRDVDLGVDALCTEIQAEGDEVHVASALAVAEEAALDAVGAGDGTSVVITLGVKHLDGGGEVEDDGHLAGGLLGGLDGLADADDKLGGGVGEGLRAKLERPLGAGLDSPPEALASGEVDLDDGVLGAPRGTLLSS